MKRAVILFVAMFVSVCSVAMAEEEYMQSSSRQRPSMQDQGSRSGMMGENKMGMKGGPMMGMQPTVVATSDGGVVVLSGPKLAKYDSGLNLVNEVELKRGPKPSDKKSGSADPDTDQMPLPDEMMDEMMLDPNAEGNNPEQS